MIVPPRALIGTILLLTLAAFSAWADTTPGADEVLRRFVGRWRTHVVITRTTLAPRELKVDGTGVGVVTLGGQYVEYRAVTDAVAGREPDEDLQINTWDAGAKVYRHWLFDSEGNRFERTGTLDSTRRVLTWTANELGGTVVIRDRFVDADRIEWDLVRRDRSGAITMRIDAWMTRVR
jgi:hypothetical protein